MDLNSKIRVVLADDQPIILQGLRYIIDAQSDMEVVGEASDGENVINIVLNTKPDVVLMDIQMPNRTGIEATSTILNSLPNVKIVLLTTFDVQEYVFDGIRAGAVGYLLKDTNTKELLDGIRWVHQGQAIYRTATASKALAEAIASEKSDIGGIYNNQLELHEPLTEREIDVLQQIAYGRRNSGIADILHISQGTVKTHVHRIIQKLGVEERTQAVVFAIRNGIVK
ncbi:MULTISPECIES: response regulator transcription factor [unclassified Clostridium]|uniref:response regulator transcription factor n=1 Tax=unclassified Clostridium TaxID=2614128 RepID=UPI00029811CC|nr:MULTISPECIES: response regulator transcription factor [unclassified Clostridium]EKQ57465.1 MAG: response regulator (CheY-like receiver and HTH DNA-binding domain containing protein) [Clostridium sp. Maddingley MBC34-26]